MQNILVKSTRYPLAHPVHNTDATLRAWFERIQISSQYPPIFIFLYFLLLRGDFQAVVFSRVLAPGPEPCWGNISEILSKIVFRLRETWNHLPELASRVGQSAIATRQFCRHGRAAQDQIVRPWRAESDLRSAALMRCIIPGWSIRLPSYDKWQAIKVTRSSSFGGQ